MDAEREAVAAIESRRFAGTLAEQEAQLREDPFVRRFAESRRALASDPHRPLYHFVSPENGLNDPNGLCFWQGRWHLFYQGYPPEAGGRVHWGHAVSDDLVHWRDLPYAIAPGPERDCYSGSAFVEDDRVIAMYHGTRAGNMAAVSSDPLLLNWDKVTGGPVIPMLSDGSPDANWRGPDGERRSFRVFDPCIWRKDGFYYSLSAGVRPDGPEGKPVRADFLLRSRDLAEWEYLHEFVEGDRFTRVGDDGACPYFWPIGERHMLLFFSHVSGGQYLLGDYDKARDRLVATAHGKFNFGPSDPAGVHAPSAAPDGEGGLVTIFNMNPGLPTQGWNQIMTLPRRLTLVGHDELRVEPIAAVASLRGSHTRVGPLSLPANEEVVLEAVSGNTMELSVELDTGSAPMVELNVLCSPGREEFTRIAFFKHRGHRTLAGGWDRKQRPSVVTIDSSYASGLPDAVSRAPETAEVFVAEDEPLRLRVFIDRSVVEVFVNGRQCVAVRVYPGRADSTGVSVRSQSREAELKCLDAWQMGAG